MTTFLIYILKWAVTLTLLYSLYGLLLRRETFHSINRTVLLAILLLSMTLPLVNIETGGGNLVSQQFNELETSLTSTATNYSAIVRILVYAYCLMAVVCLVRYLFSLISLMRMVGQSRLVQKLDGARLLVNRHLRMPCSWMCWILMQNTIETENDRMTCEHEYAHVRMRHSWDKMLSELTARLLFFLPFGWMLRKDLCDVQEYQADMYVLGRGADEEKYQRLLIKNAVAQQQSPVANSFADSPIKRRLIMMCSEPSNHRAALKAMYLVPLLLFVVVAFAKPTIVEDVSIVIEKEAQSAPLLSPVALIESVSAGSDYSNAEGEASLAEMRGNDSAAQQVAAVAEAESDATIAASEGVESSHTAAQPAAALEAKTDDTSSPAVSLPQPIDTTSVAYQHFQLIKKRHDSEKGNRAKDAMVRPMGIYRMQQLSYVDGTRIDSPIDQYKICTDSITWTLELRDTSFRCFDPDSVPFVATGLSLHPTDVTATRIFDSDGRSFSDMWWSTMKNHGLFPENRWCIEYYEAERYSDVGQQVVPLLTDPAETNKRHPLYGHWTYIGTATPFVSIEQILDEHRQGKDYACIHKVIALGKEYCVSWEGTVNPVAYTKDNHFAASRKLNGHLHSDDVLLINSDNKNCTEVWVRDKNPDAMVNKIAQIKAYAKKLYAEYDDKVTQKKRLRSAFQEQYDLFLDSDSYTRYRMFTKDQKNYDAALALIDSLIAANPGNPLFYLDKGNVHLAMGDTLKRMESYSQAAELYRNSLKTNVNYLDLVQYTSLVLKPPFSEIKDSIYREYIDRIEIEEDRNRLLGSIMRHEDQKVGIRPLQPVDSEQSSLASNFASSFTLSNRPMASSESCLFLYEDYVSSIDSILEVFNNHPLILNDIMHDYGYFYHGRSAELFEKALKAALEIFNQFPYNNTYNTSTLRNIRNIYGREVMAEIYMRALEKCRYPDDRDSFYRQVLTIQNDLLKSKIR